MRPAAGGSGFEPPVRPATAPPIQGASWIDHVPPEALSAQDRALRLMSDQLLRAGKTPADVERALAGVQNARTFHSSGVAPDATALVDVLPEWQRLAGSAGRMYPEAATDAARFQTARLTGVTPAGADARELAARGLPTRGGSPGL